MILETTLYTFPVLSCLILIPVFVLVTVVFIL